MPASISTYITVTMQSIVTAWRENSLCSTGCRLSNVNGRFINMLYAKARAQQDVYRLISVCIL